MTSRKFALICRRNLRRRRFLQILLIIAFWLVGDALVCWFGLPVPGGVVGMFILIALFVSRKFSPLNLRLGADWFLAEMLLFFIPAVPAILNHHEFLGWLGLKVLVVILAGTAAVMIVTAFVVDACFHWNSRHKPLEGIRHSQKTSADSLSLPYFSHLFLALPSKLRYFASQPNSSKFHNTKTGNTANMYEIVM